MPSAQKVRYLLSGTEAVQLVIRLARAYTGRNLFLRFDGHYHGWVDNVLGGNVNTSLDEPPYGFEKEGDLFRTVGRDPLALQQSFKIPWNDLDHLEARAEEMGRATGADHHGAGQLQRRLMLAETRLPAARARAVRPVRHRALLR